MQSKYFFKRTEAVPWRCSVKKVFLEISQISQENTCARVSFLRKLQASGGGVIEPSGGCFERSNFIQSNATKIKKNSLTFQLTFLLFIR